MKKYSLLLIVLYFLQVPPLAIGDSIQPITSFQINDSALFEVMPRQGVYSGIFFLNPIDTNTISIIVMNLVALIGFGANEMTPAAYKNNVMNIQSLQIIHQNQGWAGDLPSDELIHDATSVFINGNQIKVFDAKLEWDTAPIYITNSIGRAAISPNQQKIGGTIRYVIGDGRQGHGWDVPFMWSIMNSNMVFLENPEIEHHNIYDYSTTTIEVQFSPDSLFLLIRGLSGPPEGWPSVGVTTQSFVYPTAKLIHTETFRYWQADKDVAFTSDSRFFVTEREGKPALVDALWDHVWQWYDTGEEIMTAATFSPDDERLYIATDQNRIFVFESNLPSAGMENWELYNN